MEQRILTVTQLNTYIKGKFDTDGLLSQVCVAGEISNYKVYPSGHHYFTLKDADSAVRCVMFRGNAFSMRFRPENGMAVLAVGRVTVFPRDGAYQLYCTRLTPDGAGDLHVAFEQLKRKLEAEGLFDPAHKRPIPAYPHRIALITSAAGAAIHDMLRILGRRYPLSKVLVLPVRVQGEEAPPEICAAIAYANRYRLADVIITGRGGGSMEDLWAFNDERVARAIYASEIPVVSAVGHEPDVTISDYVADLRAATPSNAAELVAPDQLKLRLHLSQMKDRLAMAMTRKLRQERQHLDTLAKSRVLQSPTGYFQERRLRLDYASQQMTAQFQSLLARKKQDFVRRAAALDAMSPLKVLGRGYSMVFDPEGGIVRRASDTAPGEKVRIQTADGRILAAVEEIQEENRDE